MSDHSELKKVAEDCEGVRGVELIGARVKFHAAATPSVVLALIDENNRIKARLCACRDCGGRGEIYSGHSSYQGYNQPPEPDMDVCGTCGGDGVLGPVEDFEALAAERDRLKAELEALRNQASKKTDCGHGHVYPAKSGYMAKCGGPGLCALCSRDAATKAMEMKNQRVIPVKNKCPQGYGHGGQWCGPEFNCWLDPRPKGEGGVK